MGKLLNIILIVCDTLGAKHMSLYGYHRKTTPMMERLVEEAGFTVYTRCFSPAPWTAPAHASLFTGLYPSEHQTNGHNIFLDNRWNTLPEILKAIGYTTIGFSNNYLISKCTGYGRGFDQFYEMQNLFIDSNFEEIEKAIFGLSGKWTKLKILLSDDNVPKSLLIKFLVNRFYLKHRNVIYDATPFTKRTLSEAKRKINQAYREGKSYFVFINLMQTHERYMPPKELRGTFQPNSVANLKSFNECFKENYVYHDNRNEESLEFWRARYDEEVLCIDRMLYDFYCALNDYNSLDNTLFIITSDHGELFGEMGHVEHAMNTYNSLIHIPLMIKYPGENMPCLDDNIVQLHDLYALISELAEAPVPIPESSISPLSKARKFVLSQGIDWRYRIKSILKDFPEWNFKVYDYTHSNMSILIEINGSLYKCIFYSNGKWEIYELKNGLYEENNKDISVSSEIVDKVKKQLEIQKELVGFNDSIPKNEYDMDLVPQELH